MIKLVTDKTELQELKYAWDALYNRLPYVTPFQKFEYLELSLDFIDETEAKPFFIFIKDVQRKEWVAIFPFVITHKGILEFANYRHTDFCMALVDQDIDHYNIYKELADWIKGLPQVKGLNLTNILPSSPLLSVLKIHFKYMIAHDVNFFSCVPVIPNPANKDFIDSFITVPSKKRWNLRKIYKQIEEGCTLTIKSHKNNDPYPEKEINILQKIMINGGIRSEGYLSDKMFTWWRNLYENDVLSFAIVYQGSEPMSCTLVFFDNEQNECITWILLYQSSVWNMRSNLMIAKYIYDRGSGTLNLARGIYDYKVMNFHPDVKPLFRVYIAKTKWGHFKNMISTFIHYAKPIVKSWLGR